VISRATIEEPDEVCSNIHSTLRITKLTHAQAGDLTAVEAEEVAEVAAVEGEAVVEEDSRVEADGAVAALVVVDVQVKALFISLLIRTTGHKLILTLHAQEGVTTDSKVAIGTGHGTTVAAETILDEVRITSTGKLCKWKC
jgi:hypothetical protein